MTYAYVTLDISNPESLAKYRDNAQGALDAHGGTVVAVSKDARALEGEPALPEIAVILGFPDVQSATNWMEDESFSEVHAMRRGAGKTTITLLA